MLGPHKYTREFTSLLSKIKADGVVLIIVNGPQGDGFEIAYKSELMLEGLPDMLREAATQIEQGLCSQAISE